jgi:hypothetical protein
LEENIEVGFGEGRDQEDNQTEAYISARCDEVTEVAVFIL